MSDPKVRFKRSSVPGKIPNETQVPLGEIALNTYDGKVFASKNVGIGTTVFTVNPWNVGTGTDSYDINFTAGNVGVGSTIPTSKLSVVGDGHFSGVVTASSFNGYQTLLGTASSATKTFTVTVANKTANHRYFGSGSSQGYFIDGAESPFITLLPGKTYRFDQADGSNSSHPLRFYLEANRTTQYTTNVTTNGTAGSAGAYTEITIVDTTPIVLHYQCSNHAGMGNAVSNAANFIDTPYQITARSGINATGVVTATTFVGALTGNVTGTATTATNLADAANITTGTINSARLSGTYDINVSFASTAGIATVAQGLTGTPNIVVGVVTATSFVKSGGTSSQFLKADGSVDTSTYLTSYSETDTLNSVTGRGNSTTNGISVGVLTATSGNFSGIITSSGANVSGVVTASSFSGSGSQLTGIVTSLTAGTGISINQSTGNVTITATGGGGSGEGFFVQNSAGIHTLSNVGIGTTNPTSKLDVTGNVKVSGIVTATSFSGSGTNLTGIVTSITAGSGISIDQSTGNVTIISTGGAGAGVSALTSADNYIITLTPSFNGITTAFTMQYNGNNYFPLNEQQLLVSLGGVIQEPTTAYTVSSSTIRFASAPNTETDYFITALNTAPLSRNVQSYNVTGVQTNFTLTNGYTIGYVDVYLNGARLVSGDDYTATNGTTVGLTSAAQNGDVVEVVGYKAVSLSTDDLVINGNLKVTGITTLGNYVQVGVGSTALIVNGDARVTGILTVGSSSVTIDGINNKINVGTGLTITNGIVATGVITATSFVGDGSGLTGAGSTVVDDTSTNQTLYPVLTAQTSGTITASKVSTTKLSFNPSTGVISATTFNGNITGTAATFTGNVSIAGTLTYEDVTNVDSIGIVTARSGVQVTGGNLLVGSTSATGTASQPLQVTGGAYVSGNLGVGLTNPGQKLDVSGSIRASSQLISTVATGTAPLTVSSTTVVSNLNADLLDGYNVGTSGATIPLMNGSNTWSAAQTFTANLSFNTTAAERVIIFNNGTTNVYFYGQTVAAGGNQGMYDGTNGRGVWYYSPSGASFNPQIDTNVTGAITATSNITAYSSDRRLKENFKHIETPLDKIQKLNGYTFDWNEKSKELGFTPKHETNDIGLIAQEVQEVLPQAVAPAPFDIDFTDEKKTSKSGENYLTIQYERLVPLLVEAIKEQQEQINTLKEEINNLKK